MASRIALIPLLDVAATRATERATGVAETDLMERAGAGAARAVIAFSAPRDVLVACGTGNNGGDGYVVARHLAAAGIAVRVAATGVPVTAAAQGMAARWSGPVEPLATAAPAAVLVDAVLGTGRARPLAAALAAGLDRLVRGSQTVVALDVPSGVDADSGEGDGVSADLTIAFGAHKPAHALAAARCGRTVVVDLGFAPRAATMFMTAPPPPLAPAADSHKYARGAVLTLGGAAGHGGAARLAALAALRIAGLSMIACPGAALAENAARLDAVMVRAADDGAAVGALLAAHRFAALAAGPGLAIDDDRVAALLASGLPIVLDAAIFTSFAGQPERLAAAIRGPAVLTPHAGEFVRLFGDLPGNRIDRARAAAAAAGAVVLVKGPATVIAAPDGRVAINAHATPWLATAGSGDVLTGIVAGLLARGYDAFGAACAGAWLHGDAGRRAGAGMTADDLPAALAAALAAL